MFQHVCMCACVSTALEVMQQGRGGFLQASRLLAADATATVLWQCLVQLGCISHVYILQHIVQHSNSLILMRFMTCLLQHMPCSSNHTLCFLTHQIICTAPASTCCRSNTTLASRSMCYTPTWSNTIITTLEHSHQGQHIGFTLHQGVSLKAGCAQPCVLNCHAACCSVPAAACPT
jgi:hypothetical protein